MYSFFSYFVWHYSYAISNLFSLTKEFVRFVFNFFSVSLFLRTLFLPMFSAQGETKGEVYLTDAFAIIISNFFLRILGFFLRSVFIILGLIIAFVVMLLMILIAILWILIPFILIFNIYLLFNLIIL